MVPHYEARFYPSVWANLQTAVRSLGESANQEMDESVQLQQSLKHVKTILLEQDPERDTTSLSTKEEAANLAANLLADLNGYN